MTHPRFFGFGSLVNLATHEYPNVQHATLTGWRRVWRRTSEHSAALLSVERHDTTLHGITASVPNADWVALDKREHAYLRRDVSEQFDSPTAVYEANPDTSGLSTNDHPILLSYLDVVIGGYATLMGEDGPAHFFETTTDWCAVLDDREAPKYPRAQPLTDATRQAVDAGLASLNITPDRIV